MLGIKFLDANALIPEKIPDRTRDLVHKLVRKNLEFLITPAIMPALGQ
jgi:hypothetical protein